MEYICQPGYRLGAECGAHDLRCIPFYGLPGYEQRTRPGLRICLGSSYKKLAMSEAHNQTPSAFLV
jgi:hypothetical protein